MPESLSAIGASLSSAQACALLLPLALAALMPLLLRIWIARWRRANQVRSQRVLGGSEGAGVSEGGSRSIHP